MGEIMDHAPRMRVSYPKGLGEVWVALVTGRDPDGRFERVFQEAVSTNRAGPRSGWWREYLITADGLYEIGCGPSRTGFRILGGGSKREYLSASELHEAMGWL